MSVRLEGGNLLWLRLKGWFFLEGDIVTEANGGECDETIVEGIKVAPRLPPREGGGTGGHHNAWDDRYETN